LAGWKLLLAGRVVRKVVAVQHLPLRNFRNLWQRSFLSIQRVQYRQMRIRSLLRRWPVRWIGIFGSYLFLLLCLMKILNFYRQPVGVHTSECNLRNSINILNFFKSI
jgi:hypothetical protein